MDGLEKATLTPLRNTRGDDEAGTPIPVQFNPASLQLTLTNNTEGGTSRGRQARQYTGNSSTQVSFDLVFDTADEDDGSGGPRSVREKTNPIEQFVLPRGSGEDRQSPPRARFAWGDLVVTGVITSLTLDFDLFAGDGTPLRAKMAVSIQEQDPRFELLQVGAGASRAGGAPGALQATVGAVGTIGGGRLDLRADRTIEALAGESAAELAARVGLDPGAWRGLAGGLSGTLSLQAGVSIDFDASLTASVGLGAKSGIDAGAKSSLESSLGLQSDAARKAPGSAAPKGTAAGLALSSAGGVAAAIETVRIARADAATTASVRSFGAPAASSSARLLPAGPGRAATGPRIVESEASTPGRAVVPPPQSPPTPMPAAAMPTRADPRAISFGFGVPLRPRVTGASDTRSGLVALQPYQTVAEAPATRDPTIPPWERSPAGALPPRRQPPTASTEGKPHRTGCGCGCGPKGGRR